MIQRISLLLASLSVLPLLACAQLNGTYTVGGAAPDYVSVSAAVNALNAQGAAGNVIFEIRPGVYTGNNVINFISGTPGDITLRSSTMNAADVVLEHSASTDADNYILLIDSARNVHLEQLSFTALDFNFSRALMFRNKADGLTVDGCTFQGSPNLNPVGYYDANLLFTDQSTQSPQANSNNVTIRNNTFINGFGGIRLDFKPGSPRALDLLIENNRMIDQSGYGIWVLRSEGKVRNNDISSYIGEDYRGIHTAYFASGVRIEGNDIRGYSSDAIKGISFTNTQSSTNNVVRNNMVHVGAANEALAMQFVNQYGATIIGNTLVVSSGMAASSVCLYNTGNFAASDPTEVRNNIFANYAGGPAMKAKIIGNLGVLDHNNMYSSGSDLVVWADTIVYTDLSSYQAGTGMGGGSLNFDPAFSIRPDLHLNSCVLDGTGIGDTLLTVDLDGDLRSANSPDMGADEFTYSSGTITAVADTVYAGQGPLTIAVGNGSGYMWSTGETTQSIQVTASGTYTCSFTDVNGCNYTVEYPVHVVITTGIAQVRETAGMKCWPVPAMDALFHDQENADSYSIFDVTGRSMQEGSTNEHRAIDVSELPNGTYVLKTPGTRAGARFIIQR